PQAHVDAAAAFVLEECGQLSFEDEEHFLHLVRVRGVALTGLDVHDREREAARRNDARIAVLAGAARADEAVLRAPEALDLGILERGPVRFAVAKARDVALRNLLDRHAV